MRYFLYLSALLLVGCGSSSTSSCDDTQESNPLYTQSWHLMYSDEVKYPREVAKESNIHLQESWKKSKGTGVVVAIIDDSFDVEHEDLKSNIVATYNAKDGSTNVANTSLAYSHGQAVAGVIAAENNSVGSLGVAPEAKLVLIKVDLDASDDVELLKAFEYAREQKVDVINCSWGSYDMSDALSSKITQVVESGISVVFASGNDNRSLDAEDINDESEHPLVIGVSASNELNVRASYSNYGNALSILAPGGSRQFGLVTTDESGDKGFGDGNYTMYDFAGTSASTPVVSGSIALLIALNPSITPLHVKEKVQQSADKIGAVTYDENGFNSYYAYGKINVDALTE